MAKSAADIEAERQVRIETGTTRLREMFDQAFTPDYYRTQITEPATKKYTTDLNDQYRQSIKQLQFSLARTGNFNSSVANTRRGTAVDNYRAAANDITGRVKDLENTRRQNVANAESMAQSQLLSSANPAAAAAQGANMIAANSQQGAFQPLGQLFTDFSAGLATQGDLERAGTNRYNLGVSNWGDNLKRASQNISGW